MRKLVFAAAAATVAIAAAAPAFAQDDVHAPFTGPRVEALAGYDHAAGKDGFVYGGAIGYDVQRGNAVIGIEGEVTGSTIDAKSNNVLVDDDRARADLGRDLYVGGRIGFVAAPRTLVYAKAGYTNARVSASYDSPTLSVRDHDNLDGYRVGAGVEHKMAGNTYVKAEYRYSHYSDADDYGVSKDRHQVLAGVGMRF